MLEERTVFNKQSQRHRVSHLLEAPHDGQASQRRASYPVEESESLKLRNPILGNEPSSGSHPNGTSEPRSTMYPNVLCESLPPINPR